MPAPRPKTPDGGRLRSAMAGAAIAVTVVLAVLLAVLPAATAHAAGAKLDPSGAYAIRWWTVEDGLAAMPLVSVATAADDAVWCATRSQVMRFDGRRFTALPESVAAMLRGVVGDFRGLGFAPDGRLWLVGTSGAAVARPPAAPGRSSSA
jgi:hypothetical protein